MQNDVAMLAFVNCIQSFCNILRAGNLLLVSNLAGSLYIIIVLYIVLHVYGDMYVASTLNVL